ncbi:hypothetical protein [Embleya scabrispora]|uniref:hypothetical protein n=1 Tax=Embleya scabrispora TaxID=159449 RepID=UPI001319CC9B|nr:hypothetical protein [Embleya scabrispora]MYS78773.1 hypothetical protein [Streptomyces sp. SID5474]
MSVRRAVFTHVHRVPDRGTHDRAPAARIRGDRPSGVRWWTRRTTQAAAMGALMIVALAVGPSLGILPSLSARVDGVSRITNVVHDSDTPVHKR